MDAKGRRVQVEALKNQALIADKCHVAECFLDRLRGLIGKTGLQPGEALLFPKCKSIHMWFMSFPIDVVFLTRTDGVSGKTHRISSLWENVHPWRARPLTDWSASDVIELPQGTIQRCALSPGDEVCIG